MFRHNNKNSSEDVRKNNSGSSDAASNLNRLNSRNSRIYKDDDERERIRYTQKYIFRLNDLYERGSI